ncbi:MAG: helix-turn-helix transcriptional regulator [Clostridia bacterium]|nr:helix-turn-helix transcriptional regulator [Clostridia bacterium]
MNDYAFGNFLYALRTEKGLSQVQLGDMLGVTNKAVSKWENGSAKPNTVLIPRLAEILGVTVEELFACKRFEKDCEYEKIKKQLSRQKKKYAVLSSVFLSAIITIPLLLIEFICVVMGFGLPNDVAGPLGAVGFIFAFVISTTAFLIYRKNFKQAITPTEIIYTSRFIKIIENGILLSAILWWCLLVLWFSIYLLILSFSSTFIPANIFLSLAVFILIILLGTFICFANIKRLLKIKLSRHHQNRGRRIPFSELPIWAKICYIACIVLFPIVLSCQIIGTLGELFFIKFVSIVVWFAIALPLIIYRIRKQ